MALSSSFSSSVSSAGSATSTPPTTTTPSGPRPWRGVPGPSTRYHKSEHKRPKPTPRNSHNRARSSLSARSYTESAASPLARLNFSADYPKDYSTATIRPRNNPLTPLRSPHFPTQRHSFGSPFSDYFTDDAHSVENTTPYHTSDPAQKLLLRLNNLGSEILRYDLNNDAVCELSERLYSLEAILMDVAYSDSGSVTDEARGERRQSQNADALDLQDQEQGHEARHHAAPSPDVSHKSHLSDVWMADACEYSDSYTQTAEDIQPKIQYAEASTQTAEEAQDAVESGVWVADTADYADATTQTTSDRLVADLQDVVQRLAKTNDSLRHRHDQTKELSDSQCLQIEELSNQIMSLKSENDSLKSDLSFDHSELLFLKLQLQAIEVQTYDRGNRVLLADDFARWKADWDNVDARLRSRRHKSRVPSAEVPELASLGDEAESKSEDQGNWQLETRKARHGRMRSITLKRVDDVEPQDDEATLVNAQFDIPASPIKSVYCEVGTQTDEAKNNVEDEYLSEDAAEPEDFKVHHPVSESQIEDEEDFSEAEDDSESNTPKKPQPTVQEPQHLCRNCGGSISDYSSDEEEEDTIKTPWQELCDGLVAFAGMQRD